MPISDEAWHETQTGLVRLDRIVDFQFTSSSETDVPEGTIVLHDTNGRTHWSVRKFDNAAEAKTYILDAIATALQ